MAFAKSKSRKCPVCVGCTSEKVKEVDAELAPLLEVVKDEGEVPKAKDARFSPLAHKLGLSPWSLHYHLRFCLIDLEIQDQRILELKDMAGAIRTAKTEYAANPTMQNATALAALMNVFRALATDIEGQQDPEATVEFVVETVLGPMSRRTLASVSEELRSLREQVAGLVQKNHAVYIDTQIKATLQRVSSSLSEVMDEGLKNLCSYYHVELEAKARKRAIEAGSLTEAAGKVPAADDDDAIH